MSKLQAHEVALKKIFSSDYDFLIPPYQRPYAWGTEETEQLLEDLDYALEQGEEEPYFLGSIVLVKSSGGATAEVIDGQQRLTTLTMLLAVLRDLEPADSDLQREIDSMVQEPGSIMQGLEKKPRLTLRKRDAVFFANNVQAAGATTELIGFTDEHVTKEVERSLRDNVRALEKKLRLRTDEQRLKLLALLSSRTILVVVSTADLDSAHRVFGVLNARGLDLSPTDIFKSAVMGAMGPVEIVGYTDLWETCEERLGRDGFLELFLHIRMIWSKERGRRELLKEFPVQVLDGFLDDRAGAFVEDVLVPYGEALLTLSDESYTSSQGADEVNRWIRRLNQLDNNDWRPPALWALRHHRYDPAFLTMFLKKLERLAASMFIRRVYSTPRVIRYGDLLKQLDAEAGLDAEAFDISETGQAATIAMLDGDVYLVQSLRKYLLLRVDEVLGAESGVTQHHKTVMVEHVLPQSPPDGSEWRDLFDEQERQTWTHKLANLVLLNRSKNSSAGVLDFQEKKAKYFVGTQGVPTFALTIQVLSTEEWTPEVLATRQASLISLLRAGVATRLTASVLRDLSR